MAKEKNQKVAQEIKNSVMSQEQIDELLNAIAAGDDDYTQEHRTRRIKIYDFKRPDVFSKQELRDISCIAENVARALVLPATQKNNMEQELALHEQILNR